MEEKLLKNDNLKNVLLLFLFFFFLLFLLLHWVTIPRCVSFRDLIHFNADVADPRTFKVIFSSAETERGCWPFAKSSLQQWVCVGCLYPAREIHSKIHMEQRGFEVTWK